MKIVVTGATGLLGRDVWRRFERDHELIGIGRTAPAFIPTAQWRTVDLTDASRVYSIITKDNPEVVVHCAAYSAVDDAERDPVGAYRGNALATRNVAYACQRFDAALVHISTDYVFDGENAPSTGYREFDPVHPLSRYAESKVWAEQIVRDLLNRWYIVRTSWLFGPGRATWVDASALAAQEGKVINAVSDMVSAPTYTPDLAEALWTLVESRLYGIYHLTNSGFCSRTQLAEELLRLQGKSEYPHLRRFKQEELRLAARRPAFSGLDNLAWKLQGYKPLRAWQEALAEHFSKSKVKL